MSVAAFDLTPGKLSSALFSRDGEMVHKDVKLLFKKEGKEIGNLVISRLKELIDLSIEKDMNLTSIGISVPGIWNRKEKRVWAPNLPGWENYPLEDEIRNVTDGCYHLRIDNDRACSIMGEIWRGEARGADNAVFITVGMGIGAGIMVDGKILRGKNDIAGAVGWLAMGRPFQERYSERGFLEDQASSEGLVSKAERLIRSNPAYSGSLKRTVSGEMTIRDLFEAYKENDEVALKVIGESIELWGMTAANMISLFDPEKIIFGGSLFGPASRFLDEIYREAERWAQPLSMPDVEIKVSALKGDASLYGAGKLARLAR